MFASAATPIGTTGASEPPARTTSHSPVRIRRSASWKAMTDVAHAATWVITGPVSPYSIDSSAAAHRARQRRDRERRHEPRALRVVDVGPVDDLLDPAAAGVDDDADPVALLLAHRREVDPAVGDRLLAGGHREVDEAGHPAGHLRVHGHRRVEVEDLGRDLDLEARSRRSSGSGRVPVTPATRFDQYVGKSFPIGMTAPRPVTTARRAGSSSGTDDHLRKRGHGRIVRTRLRQPAGGRVNPRRIA